MGLDPMYMCDIVLSTWASDLRSKSRGWKTRSEPVSE